MCIPRAIKPEGSYFQEITGAEKEAKLVGSWVTPQMNCVMISTREFSGADTVSPSPLSQGGGYCVHFYNLILQ